MLSLVKMTKAEKDNFQPQPSEVDRRYEKCSHVEIVDSLHPPTVVDTRKSVEDARAKGAAHELPIQDGAVGTSETGILTEKEFVMFMGRTACKDRDLIQTCWNQFVLRTGSLMLRQKWAIDLIKVRMAEALPAPVIAALGEGTRGEKRPRSSNEVVGGPSQGEEGVEGGGGTGDGPPKPTRKKRGGARR